MQAGNAQVLPPFDHPVLIEGANDAGIWQECGSLKALVYRRTEAGFGQIEMVVPIAATTWELARNPRDEL